MEQGLALLFSFAPAAPRAIPAAMLKPLENLKKIEKKKRRTARFGGRGKTVRRVAADGVEPRNFNELIWPTFLLKLKNAQENHAAYSVGG